jgi:hypothetical protein
MSVPAFKSRSGSGIGGQSVPAFSKKKGGVSTVGGGGQRAGFTPNVRSTNTGRAHSAPGMAGGASPGKFKSDTKTTGPLHGVRPVKTGGKGLKSAPAFSKKKI